MTEQEETLIIDNCEFLFLAGSDTYSVLLKSFSLYAMLGCGLLHPARPGSPPPDRDLSSQEILPIIVTVGVSPVLPAQSPIINCKKSQRTELIFQTDSYVCVCPARLTF